MKLKFFIQELEKRDNLEKREYIKSFLNEKKIPFKTQTFKTLFASGENIIVDYPFDNGIRNQKKILLTAHYNAWFKSPGANDNCSGVVVLMGFIERLLKHKPTNTNIRLIFFDLEDGPAIQAGSKKYIKEFGTSNIKAIYNLEMVGMGQVLLLWPSKENDIKKRLA